MNTLFKNNDAVIILSPSNLFYFSGYTNADAVILLTPKEKFYISDKRITEEAGQLLKDFKVVDCNGKGYTETAIELAKDLGVKSIGFEDEEISYKEYLNLASWDAIKVHASRDIQMLRAVKTPQEIELMKKAQAITDTVFAKLLNYISVGMTELQVSNFMNKEMYGMGGELAFETIVAFGKNTSRPHAHPSDNKLLKDDVVTVDFGAKFGGYCSDMTRSFAIGKVSQEYVDVYNHVLNAQTTALKHLRAGMVGKDGDYVARKYFEDNDVANYFTHSLGHSLGVDIHENPGWRPSCLDVIPEGAVLSVEPGLYYPAKFGVRIEDIAVFNNNGSDNLTKSDKKLIIL